MPDYTNDTVEDTADPTCRLLVTPSTLDFAIAASDAPSEPKTVTLKAECPGQELTVFNLKKIEGGEVDGEPVFRVVDDELALFASLSDGDALAIPVVFAPPRGGTFEARIPLGVSPIDSPGDILLSGQASGPSPLMSATQAEDTLLWCASHVAAKVENGGPDVLTVRDLQFADHPDCASFVITEDVVGTDVEEGARLDLPVSFRPVKPGPHACGLHLVTDVSTAAIATLRGTGLPNTIAQERFRVSDGSGANVLLLFDDDATDLGDARNKLSTGLGTLVTQLREQSVDFRITAASTSDACTVGPFTHGTPMNSDDDILELLRDNLFDESGTAWANQPLALMTEVSGKTGTLCFSGWYEDHEPLHTIIVAGRDDASGRTANAWVNAAMADLPGGVSISVISASDECSVPAERLEAAARLTSGLELDLCAANWTNHWYDLARHTALLREQRRAFTLAAPPLEGSVQVAVNGIATTDFTVVDEVVTVGANVPDGAEVLVRYADAGTCE